MFARGSPAAAQSLTYMNVLGALNYPSDRGTQKMAESKHLLLVKAQHGTLLIYYRADPDLSC